MAVDKTAEHPTKLGYWHGSVIAEDYLNIGERRLQQLAKDGDLPKSWRGWYPLADTVKAYCMYLQARTKGRPETKRGEDRDEIDIQRVRKLKMENDITEGSLLHREAVQAVFLEACALLSAEMDGAAGRMAGGNAILRQRLLNEHRKIRANFADRLEARADTSEGGGDSPSAA